MYTNPIIGRDSFLLWNDGTCSGKVKVPPVIEYVCMTVTELLTLRVLIIVRVCPLFLGSSDATNIESSIKRDGDFYILNGRKWSIASYVRLSKTALYAM